MSGLYCLVVALEADATIAVGALGERSFTAGGYAYVGSARGPGGFARLDRHREVAAGERDGGHWHVHHLLGHPAARVAGDVRARGAAAECRLADALEGAPVAGFGCTDCGCGSHLFRYPDAGWARADARRAIDGQSGTSR